jgi:hypothetical protein
MSVQHANRGVIKKDLQLYYNREFSKSFRGESSTNLITNTVTSSGPWDGNLFNNWINATVTENVDMAPDGTMTAVRLTGGYARWTNSITVDASTTYTASIWLKNINLGVDPAINIATGLNGTLVSYVVANSTITRSTIANWRRVSVTYTIPASGVNQIQFGVRYEGDYPNQNSILVWGAQFEKKAYMTQYSNLATDYFSRNETTTNLLTSTYSSLPTNWSVDSSGFGVAGTYSYIENNSAIRIVDVNTNTRFLVANISGFSASTTYTFSVKYRKVSGTPTLRFQIQWLNSSNVQIGSVSFPTTPQVSIYNIDGWQLAKFTVTSPVNTAKVTWFIQDGDDYTGYTHSYDLKEPQIQTGTYPTKWTSNTATANTLTSGGGLLDISGNNYNIDLTSSAIAFDSGGYYFNGNAAGGITIPVANSILDTLSNITHTYEVWFKLLGTPPGASDGYFFGRQGYHEGFAHFKSTPTTFGALTWYNDNTNTGWLYYAGSLNVWYHAAYVVNVEASTRELYINGVLNSNGTLTKQLKQYVSGPSYYYHLGSANPEYASNIIVSSAKAYNKALTAAEVLQNFNATRKTYGI